MHTCVATQMSFADKIIPSKATTTVLVKSYNKYIYIYIWHRLIVDLVDFVQYIYIFI